MRASIARDPDEFEELPTGVSLRERLCRVCRTMTEPLGNAAMTASVRSIAHTMEYRPGSGIRSTSQPHSIERSQRRSD
jgi:hypothetical protein